MENNKQKPIKMPESNPNGCLLGCMGITVGIIIVILSTMLLYNACYDEYGLIDPNGDYILCNSDQDISMGTWVIENPYYFVQKETTVMEMENWRQTKLVISEDGTFELIRPIALLAKSLLVSDFKLKNLESFVMPENEIELVRQAMSSSILGQWSKQTDDSDKSYFRFQTDESNLPQRIQIANVKKDSIRKGRLEEGMRLHWSISSYPPHYPRAKEGIVWKRCPSPPPSPTPKTPESPAQNGRH